MRRLALVPTLAAVLLFPPSAAALGLGEIEMQSALNQQLDAEIPLRGVPADQSDDIVVALASEEAFENVGLERPFALTRLEFTVKQRDGGSYFVHVTSSKPIVEPFLSFLLEVDWPGGNLLREYTVLLDPPVFATEESGGSGDRDAAKAASTGDGESGAGMPGEIEREAASDSGEASAAEDVTADESGAAESDSGQAKAQAEPASGAADEYGEKPVFLQVEEREERAERAAAERAEAEAEAQARAESEQAAASSTGSSDSGSGQYGPVKQGDTLWSIASRLKSGDMTVQQMMLALLRYNPEAFGGENINRLKQGYVLRVPNRDEVQSISAQRALARVREQNSMWQQMRADSAAGDTVAASEQSAGQPSASEPSQGSAGGDGELSIVGADEGGASSDESASATGNQEASDNEKLQLAREQLESTRMEKKELESRVKQLEETVAKMEKLLTVRNERLTALQEELRKLEGRRKEAGESDGEDAQDETKVAESGAAEETVDGSDSESVDSAGADDTGGGEDAVDEETVAASDAGTAGSGGSGSGGSSGSSGGSGDGDTSGADSAADGESDTTTATADSGESAASGDSAGDAATANAQQDAQVAEEDSGPVTTRTQPPEKIWLDKVNDFFAAAGGLIAGIGGGLMAGPVGLVAAAVLLLLIVGFVVMRHRREAADEALEDVSEPLDPDAQPAPFDPGASGGFEASEEAGSRGSSSETDDGESALMAEQFDVGSLDEDASGEHADSSDEATMSEASAGVDEEEADKDDTVAEADVYLAYGLHQQAEDLLRLALRENPDKAAYHEKLLETLHASGKSEAFVEEAGQFRQRVDSPQSRPWQRVLVMGREIAPQHELFAEGDTAGSAADVQPSRPGATEIDLDDTSEEIDFGLDSDGGDDEFSRTMVLDSGESGAVEGDGGLSGPEQETGSAASGDAAQPATEEDEDLEFDLGDLGALGTDEETGPASASAGTASDADDGLEFDLGEPDAEPAAPHETEPEKTSAADDDFGFELDLDANESPGETVEAASGDSDDEGFEFDFDLEKDSGSGEPAPAAAPTETSTGAEPTGDGSEAIDDALEIGDLELGDLEAPGEGDETAGASVETEASTSPAPEGEEDAALELSDLDTGGDDPTDTATDERSETSTGPTPPGGDDDAFDLSDLDTGDSDSTDTAADEGSETPSEPAPGGAAEDTFDLSDLDTGDGDSSDTTPDEPTEASATPAPAGEDDDAFDLSDLDTGEGDSADTAADESAEESASGRSAVPEDEGTLDLSDLEAAGGDDEGADDSFNLDDLGLEESAPASDESDVAGAAGSPRGAETGDAESGGGDVDTAPVDEGGEDEFDTMLDLARAYIDMGDPDSAANALEEVASAGNEKQRGEAESLLESVR